jgi:zeaxanthin glucosyltransferase
MSKILIDILPALGHFNSSLKLIQMLRSRGHEVIFIDQDLKAELARFGFRSISTGFILPPILLKKGDIRLWKSLKNLFSRSDENYAANFTDRFKSFKEFIKKLSPDIVILDEQVMFKAIYYEICKVPVISIESKPEPSIGLNVPPFTSSFIPSETFISRWICNILWINKIIDNRLRLKMIGSGSKGNDIYNITKKIASSNGIDLESRICLKRGYGIGIKGIPRLNVSAGAFDFHRKMIRDTYYVGPFLDIDREDEYDQIPRYKVLRNILLEFRATNLGSVIYCSLGSYNVMFQEELCCFFLKLKKVALDNQNDLFIISTGDCFDAFKLYPLPDNMFVFEYLPQIKLLGYCDIMITHGGINSITECVYYEIPTLNYPVSNDWDQPGCAARVLYHKIGMSGSIFKDSPKKITKKLDMIKTNYSYYQMNIRKMKKQFEEKNNSMEAVEVIEGLIKQNHKEYELCKYP